MKKYSGFTLLEVMLSFLILTVMTSTLIPAFITIYEERITIKEQQQAHQYIKNIIQAWLYDDKTIPHHEIITIKGTDYLLETENIGNELKVCLTWDGSNARAYSICNYGKKTN